jgi:hypothetical protein
MSNIKRLYTNYKFSGSLSGLRRFIQNRKLTQQSKEVKNTLLGLPAYYKHIFVKKRFKKRRVLVHFVNWQLIIDLIDMQKYASVNNGFRYILIGIDGFSRKLFLHNKYSFKVKQFRKDLYCSHKIKSHKTNIGRS